MFFVISFLFEHNPHPQICNDANLLGVEMGVFAYKNNPKVQQGTEMLLFGFAFSLGLAFLFTFLDRL